MFLNLETRLFTTLSVDMSAAASSGVGPRSVYELQRLEARGYSWQHRRRWVQLRLANYRSRVSVGYGGPHVPQFSEYVIKIEVLI